MKKVFYLIVPLILLALFLYKKKPSDQSTVTTAPVQIAEVQVEQSEKQPEEEQVRRAIPVTTEQTFEEESYTNHLQLGKGWRSR